jgi:FMN-dependent NADH-azoreductase
MPSLLHIDSSIDPARSRSRAITAAFADAWRARGPEYTIVRRDLHERPVPHLTDASSHWAQRLRRPEDTPPAAESALQQELLDELIAADALVIGAPMYNYSEPSTLKAWIDHIHVPGVTAPFDTPDQPMAGKPAVLVTSRGAVYDAGMPTEGWDHTIPPLQLILGNSLGMAVSVIAVNLTLSDFVPALADQRPRAEAELAAAKEEAARLATTL